MSVRRVLCGATCLWNELSVIHFRLNNYILEESNFSFRYGRLCDLGYF